MKSAIAEYIQKGFNFFLGGGIKFETQKHENQTYFVKILKKIKHSSFSQVDFIT